MKIIWSKIDESFVFSSKYNFSQKKRKHETWEKSKQRHRNERKFRVKRKNKNIKKQKFLKKKKIKRLLIPQNKIKLNKIVLQILKNNFYKKLRNNTYKKKKYLQHKIRIKKKFKNKKIIYFYYKTKKWSILLNNKFSYKHRSKRRTRRFGRRIKSAKIFFQVKKLQNGKWTRRRKKVFKIRNTLKFFVKKLNNRFPAYIKNYFSNPQRKKKRERFVQFSYNFLNNVNILTFRLGLLPTISLSIEANNKNWICANFEVKPIGTALVNPGDSLTLYPSFEVFSNFFWMKQIFNKYIFFRSVSKKEFYVSKKPLLIIFIKLQKKNLIINNSPKDWIKMAYIKNLKLIT